VESQSTRWIAAALARRSGIDPDAIQIADATIAVWHDMTTSLKSVIGRQGVSALYERSVALTVRAYPWLAISRVGVDHAVDLDALQAVIARQSAVDAAKGVSELLETFYDVLVGLIGRALSEQLLASVRENSALPRPRDPQHL
jgi:hypothetical protein